MNENYISSLLYNFCIKFYYKDIFLSPDNSIVLTNTLVSLFVYF